MEVLQAAMLQQQGLILTSTRQQGWQNGRSIHCNRQMIWQHGGDSYRLTNIPQVYVSRIFYQIRYALNIDLH